ncbi:helix-turn-helix domain-containing protein [Lysinibacillus fusiformis]
MEDLPTDILAVMPKDETLDVKREFPLGTGLHHQLEHYEREIILDQLAKVNGNKKTCAKILGITRATLYNRLNKLNIDV